MINSRVVDIFCHAVVQHQFAEILSVTRTRINFTPLCFRRWPFIIALDLTPTCQKDWTVCRLFV